MTQAQMQARLVELRDEIYSILVDKLGHSALKADQFTLQKSYTPKKEHLQTNGQHIKLLDAKYEEKNELEDKLGLE